MPYLVHLDGARVLGRVVARVPVSLRVPVERQRAGEDLVGRNVAPSLPRADLARPLNAVLVLVRHAPAVLAGALAVDCRLPRELAAAVVRLEPERIASCLLFALVPETWSGLVKVPWGLHGVGCGAAFVGLLSQRTERQRREPCS